MAEPRDQPPPGGASGGGQDAAKPTVENRWWVDSGTPNKRRSPTPTSERPAPPIVGDRFFAVGRDFDQDRARARLTDANLNLLREANPPEDGWGYLAMTEQRSPEEYLERIRRAIRLPCGSRAVLVDSGSSVRAIFTGKPFGEQVVELTLGGDSSLDVWRRGEWVTERAFRSRERALREASHLVARHLRPTE
ncbi:MAG: hypothetical protein AB1689_21075 [Thermodesulfobacteriota bacterium]